MGLMTVLMFLKEGLPDALCCCARPDILSVAMKEARGMFGQLASGKFEQGMPLVTPPPLPVFGQDGY